MCGIFGFKTTDICEDVSNIVYHGLIALQHRGQESVGIATTDGYLMRCEKMPGRVDRFENQLLSLEGEGFSKAQSGIGHVRYSNTGGDIIGNYQPFVKDTNFGQIALVHNGNLVNTDELRRKVETLNVKIEGNTDSELIALLISMYSYQSSTIEEAIHLTLNELIGAYSLIIMTHNEMFGIRDPHGIRPLCFGRRNSNDFIFASETCALESIRAKFEFEVKPGEMVIASNDGKIDRIQILEQVSDSECALELIYYSQPSSKKKGHSMDRIRGYMGEWLHCEHPVQVEDHGKWIVTGVPDSGLTAAEAFARASGLNYCQVMLKNRYIGRTFIKPSPQLREEGVIAKFWYLDEKIAGKNVVLVDDSIVRGTSTKIIVKELFNNGALSVHVRISSPPCKYCCHLGIDTQKRAELIASIRTIDEIRHYIGATSLGYLSVEGLMKSICMVESDELIDYSRACIGCFTSKYPIGQCDRICQEECTTTNS